ncbi:hypothetical protein B7P43_G00615 [Cryptotermes secundus]|uniref:Uncharacterized protein n=1 Tax=Cryptotermes secundus TaxID=105785 RepID=A0A2J7PUZ4_9NEOP|nr:hypothetical protein B7P43_G00615 [Cryptotermes secundus]
MSHMLFCIILAGRGKTLKKKKSFGEACLLGDSHAVEQMDKEEGEEEQISCFVFKWTNMNSKFYERHC